MKAKQTINEKKSITQKTSFFVCSYTMLIGLLMLIQVLPMHYISLFGLTLNTKLSLPLDVMATALIAICAGYCGVDRAAFAISSAQLEHGVSNVGNPKSIRNVIYWTFAIFIEGVVISLFFDAAMPLTTLGTSLASSVLLYVTGNKVITLCGNINGKQKDAVAQDSYTQEELHKLEIEKENTNK